jgi:hypothetical protein
MLRFSSSFLDSGAGSAADSILVAPPAVTFTASSLRAPVPRRGGPVICVYVCVG